MAFAMDQQQEEFESALAMASPRLLQQVRHRNLICFFAMAPARVPETDRMLNCARVL